jgi:hypothetical protein
MCVFCTAIPATATIGVTVDAKRRKDIREAIHRGEVPKKDLPIKTITAVAVGTLIVASVATHTYLYK